MHFTVLSLKDGTECYHGESLTKCAMAMVPGTVYGKGDSPSLADRAARIQLNRYGVRPASSNGAGAQS